VEQNQYTVLTPTYTQHGAESLKSSKMTNDKLTFLKGIFGNCKYSSNTKEAEFYCFYCKHHKPKLSINLTTDVYHCWVCNKSGTILSLLRDQKISSDKVSHYIATFKPRVPKSSSRCAQIFVGENYYNPSLPKEYQALSSSRQSIMCKKAFDYLYGRGITNQQILTYKLGYCLSGDYANRVIIPSFDKDGNLNFFTSRDITDLSGIPYLNDKKLPKGYKNTIIINELNLDFKKPIVVVEGYFDMFKSTSNTTPLCGSSLTKENLLFQTLVKNETDVILALDPDAFFDKTLKVAKLMLSYGLNVRSADFRPFKDLGKMTREEGIERINNARSVDEPFLRRMKLKGLFKDD
jgi:DNA primase